MPLLGDLGEGLLKEVLGRVLLPEKEALGLDHAVEAGGGQAEGADDFQHLVEVDGGVNTIDQSAGKEAQHVDLFGEAFEVGGEEVAQVALVEAAGVEAVAEGVEVAGLAAALAGGRSCGHGAIIAQMFCFGKGILKEGGGMDGEADGGGGWAEGVFRSYSVMDPREY
jgi:hypothetical protein